MKKLSLKLTGIKAVLRKEEMKQIKGGGSLVNCFDECEIASGCGTASCVPGSCYRPGGTLYNACL